MGNNEDDDEFIDKELDDLNKIILSANNLVNQMNSVNVPVQQHMAELLNKSMGHQVPITNSPTHNTGTTILNCINKSKNPIPKFENDGDSGFDLRANLVDPIILKSKTMAAIPTGLIFSIQNGYEIQIRPINKLIVKNNVITLNTEPIVDNNDGGGMIILLFNFGQNDVQINHGDKIALGVVCPVIGSGNLTILDITQNNN